MFKALGFESEASKLSTGLIYIKSTKINVIYIFELLQGFKDVLSLFIFANEPFMKICQKLVHAKIRDVRVMFF